MGLRKMSYTKHMSTSILSAPLLSGIKGLWDPVSIFCLSAGTDSSITNTVVAATDEISLFVLEILSLNS